MNTLKVATLSISKISMQENFAEPNFGKTACLLGLLFQ